MHVTVLYGIHSECPNKTKKSLKGNGSVKVKFGEVNVFTNPDNFDVVVVDVISKDLVALNEKLKKEVPFTNKYDSYRPHVTIAYIKKGKGEKHKGVDVWENEEFKTNKIIFSSKNGTKNSVRL